jgi:hypothetical protein
MSKRKRGRPKLSKQVKITRLANKLEVMMANAVRIPCPELGSDCLIINATRNTSGYPLIWAKCLGFGASPAPVHVCSYMIRHGIHNKSDIPYDRHSASGRKELHHKCNEFSTTAQERYLRRGCINSDHILPLTRLQNMARVPHELRVQAAAQARAHNRVRLPATCHPSEKAHALTLCKHCYDNSPLRREEARRKYARDPVLRAKQCAASKRRYESLKAKKGILLSNVPLEQPSS